MMSRRIRVDFNNAAEWVPPGTHQIANDHPDHRDDSDMKRLDREGCGALTIGHVPDPARFSADHPEGEFVTDFTLIKRSGDDVYHIPEIFKNHMGAIMTIAEDQEARSKLSRLKYAFAMLHRRHVPAGQFHRNDNWHRDTMPGEIRRNYQCADRVPCQIYLTSDVFPTVVQTEPVADAAYLFRRDRAAEVAPHSRQLKPYEITLMNDYVYHRGVIAEEPAMRNFLVVMYASRKEVETLLGKKTGWRDMFKLT
jgi:hypothetical protein